MATMQDVARVARVSVATVSATLNGTARVSPTLTERVYDAIREVGYHPNAIARSLKKGRTGTLGLIVPDINNPFFTTVIHSVERTAQAAGYSVILCNSDNDAVQERHHCRLLRSRMVDGLILAPVGEAGDYDGLLAEGQPPIVLFDRTIDGAAVDTVLVDAEAAIETAIRHLIALGHRRIGFLAGPAHLSTSQARLRGFHRAHEAAGLSADESLIRSGRFLQQEAYDATLRLLGAGRTPTAMFASNNLMAIGMMLALRSIGLRCPEDVSIACFDDFDWAELIHPRLTTVAQPTGAIGREALGLLVSRLADGGAARPPRRIVLETTLIIRDSTAAPRVR